MIIRIFHFLVTIILCGMSIAFAGEKIIIQSNEKVDFTPYDKLDTYEVTVKGTTPDDYVITYHILTYDGTEVYSFAALYANVGVDPSENTEDIQQDLKRQTDNPCRTLSGSLLSWTDLKKQEPGLTLIPKLSKSDYNRLREENIPMCSHSSGYERYQYVVFDPLKKKARVIAEVCW